MVRGKNDWKLYAGLLQVASSKQLTAEQFAKEINTDVKLVRQDYQSCLGKIRAGVVKQAKSKYAVIVAEATEAGEEVEKSEAQYIADSVEKNLAKYELKSAKGRRAGDLGIEFDLDDEA
jgi:hypothetical protein